MRKTLLGIYDNRVRPILYALREWWPFWFNVLNYGPRKLHDAAKDVLDPLEQRLSEELSRTGIVVTSLDELFGGKYTLDDLRAYIKSLPPPEKKEVEMKKDVFQSRLWSIKPTLDLDNPFLKLTLEPRVMRIVNRYMQMWTKLKYYDLAITHPVAKDSGAVYSQRWHRDPEEKRIVKMFIYMTDVDADSGPFVYVPGSVYGLTPYGSVFPQCPPAGVYVDDETFDRQVPKSAQKAMLGKAGSVILSDATGLHRGGLATEHERIMYTAFFSAPSSTQEVWYSPKDGSTLPKDLPEVVRYALTHP
jgi:hypothetical protein